MVNKVIRIHPSLSVNPTRCSDMFHKDQDPKNPDTKYIDKVAGMCYACILDMENEHIDKCVTYGCGCDPSQYDNVLSIG